MHRVVLKGDAMDLSGVEESLRKWLQEYVMPKIWDEVEFSGKEVQLSIARMLESSE
jgi:hypothetical protein